MFTDFIPMLHARGVNQADIASILEDNPRRFFAGELIPEAAR
jgi:phosphotriesterase-related protein